MKKAAGQKAKREAVKLRLQQYHTARQGLRILAARRRTLLLELQGPDYAHARMDDTDIPAQIAGVEARIDRQQAELAGIVQSVMDLVDLLPVGSMERTVVELRHIDCKSWERIAATTHMSRSAVFNHYGAALDMLSKKSKGPTVVS